MSELSRAQIAAALGTIPDVTAYESVPDVIAQGAAWPVWVSSRYISMGGEGALEQTWWVFIALAAGTPAASIDSAEPLIRQLGSALRAIGLTGGLQIEPWTWQLEPGGSSHPTIRATATA